MAAGRRRRRRSGAPSSRRRSSATSARASSGAWSSSTSTPARSSTRSPAASHLPFRFTINAYRGCSHACTYCFARPTHEYLDLGHRATTSSARSWSRSTRWSGCGPSWRRAGGRATTSPWAPTPTPTSGARASTTSPGASSRCWPRPRNPFSILTKSTLILRDLDLLAEAAARAPTCGPTSPSAPSTRRCGGSPSRARPTPCGGSRRWPGSTRPGCRAACWWRRCCRGCPTRPSSWRRW